MADRKLDLTRHESQPVTERLVRHADVILAMTRSHREAIAVQWPHAAERSRVLCRNGSDISDPIGGSKELYAQCADQIDEQLRQYIAEWDLELVLPNGHDGRDKERS
jgi:protein-tyrosine phosphatase